MEQRTSMITLGVSDVAASRAFYEELGWTASELSNESVTFFQAGGMVLGLYGREDLAEDMRSPAEGSGFSGVALAYNVRRKDEVKQVLEAAEQAGASILKPADDTFWGGHSGYFVDLDGHAWEVAWNPGFAFKTDGSIVLPE